MSMFVRGNFFNVENEHFLVDLTIGLLNTVILVSIDVINVIFITIINLQ